MIKALRKKKFVQITMWALVVVFALWGAGSVAGSRRTYAGVIFGRKITAQEYNRSYNSVLIRAKMAYGDELSKMEKFLNLGGQAWDRLILKHEARKRFIRVSNKEVIARIATLQLFQRNGLFNKRLYDHIVGTVFRTTPRDFEESVRGDIIIDKLADSVTKDIGITGDEIRKVYLAENEQGDVSFILINRENYKDRVDINDEEIFAFYQERMDSFRSPVKVNVTYLRIPFADDNEKEEAMFTAEELASYIKQGKTFEWVADEYGFEPKETGFFSVNSTIPEIGLSYPFTLAALNLKKDQVSDTVETSDSFCIMKLKDRSESKILSFDEAKDEARNMLILKKEESLAEADAKKLLTQTEGENMSLEDAAQKSNYYILSSKEITRKSYIEEIGLSDSFVEVAFSLKMGEAGGPVKTEKGYAVVRLDDLKPIDEEDFEKQKNSIARTVLQRKKTERFKKWFMDLKARAAPKNN